MLSGTRSFTYILRSLVVQDSLACSSDHDFIEHIPNNMSTHTPSTTVPSRKRSTSQAHSRAQTPPPRPTTPLRPLSRGSLRSSYASNQGQDANHSDPIASLEPAFAEFSDGMADLEANFMHLQLLHESLSRFNECFASFLYGLNVNAWCVDFTEVNGMALLRGVSADTFVGSGLRLLPACEERSAVRTRSGDS